MTIESRDLTDRPDPVASQASQDPVTATPQEPPPINGSTNATPRGAADLSPASLVPAEGWHVLHMFYRIDRAALTRLDSDDLKKGRRQFLRALDPQGEGAPTRLQCFAVPGHKADFGFIAAGPDLYAVHGVQRALEQSRLGPALRATASFYSLTEISEYVPDPAAYGDILKRDGLDPASDLFKAKLATYERRLGPMNEQRVHPEFPDWPCLCFYPMSKTRLEGQNWYLLPFEQRAAMMAQHGKSGMNFAGKVIQVITASTGLDDWEWGVTLWARNPSYLKEIVYTMRFDEASARYALFGPFYFGYLMNPEALAKLVGLE